jgi:ribosomal protein L33
MKSSKIHPTLTPESSQQTLYSTKKREEREERISSKKFNSVVLVHVHLMTLFLNVNFATGITEVIQELYFVIYSL